MLIFIMLNYNIIVELFVLTVKKLIVEI